MNSIILDLHFPSICYRKLLSPPVVPSNNNARVGIVRNFNLDDLAQFMPVGFYSSLKKVLMGHHQAYHAVIRLTEWV